MMSETSLGVKDLERGGMLQARRSAKSAELRRIQYRRLLMAPEQVSALGK